MATLTNSLMLLVMLLHAAFGCSWHHAHSETTAAHGHTDESAPATEVASTSCHGHHHHPGSPFSTPEPEHSPTEPCEEGHHCVFVAQSVPSMEGTEQLALPLDWVFLSIQFEQAHLLSPRSDFAESRLRQGGPARPERSLLCVWQV